VTAADETTQHFAMDTPDDLMLICAGSPIGALSMVMPDSVRPRRPAAALRF
jgi:hypothetical protein